MGSWGRHFLQNSLVTDHCSNIAEEVVNKYVKDFKFEFKGTSPLGAEEERIISPDEILKEIIDNTVNLKEFMTWLFSNFKLIEDSEMLWFPSYLVQIQMLERKFFPADLVEMTIIGMSDGNYGLIEKFTQRFIPF